MELKCIEEIRESTDIKEVKSCCNRVLKKLSFKSVNDLKNLSELAMLLYIYDRFDDALSIAEIVKDVNFTGNYTVWSEIEVIRAVAIRILRENSKNSEAYKILITLMPYFKPELYHNQKEMLTTIYDRNIIHAKENISKSIAISWMFVKFGLMIVYYETPEFPVDKKQFNEEIVELKNELKQMIK